MATHRAEPLRRSARTKRQSNVLACQRLAEAAAGRFATAPRTCSVQPPRRSARLRSASALGRLHQPDTGHSEASVEDDKASTSHAAGRLYITATSKAASTRYFTCRRSVAETTPADEPDVAPPHKRIKPSCAPAPEVGIYVAMAMALSSTAAHASDVVRPLCAARSQEPAGLSRLRRVRVSTDALSESSPAAPSDAAAISPRKAYADGGGHFGKFATGASTPRPRRALLPFATRRPGGIARQQAPTGSTTEILSMAAVAANAATPSDCDLQRRSVRQSRLRKLGMLPASPKIDSEDLGEDSDSEICYGDSAAHKENGLRSIARAAGSTRAVETPTIQIPGASSRSNSIAAPSSTSVDGTNPFAILPEITCLDILGRLRQCEIFRLASTCIVLRAHANCPYLFQRLALHEFVGATVKTRSGRRSYLSQEGAQQQTLKVLMQPRFQAITELDLRKLDMASWNRYGCSWASSGRGKQTLTYDGWVLKQAASFFPHVGSLKLDPDYERWLNVPRVVNVVRGFRETSKDDLPKALTDALRSWFKTRPLLVHVNQKSYCISD